MNIVDFSPPTAVNCRSICNMAEIYPYIRYPRGTVHVSITTSGIPVAKDAVVVDVSHWTLTS